jgi:hypothetical protein
LPRHIKMPPEAILVQTRCWCLPVIRNTEVALHLDHCPSAPWSATKAVELWADHQGSLHRWGIDMGRWRLALAAQDLAPRG